jgi:hypothetical protein
MEAFSMLTLHKGPLSLLLTLCYAIPGIKSSILLSFFWKYSTLCLYSSDLLNRLPFSLPSSWLHRGHLHHDSVRRHRFRHLVTPQGELSLIYGEKLWECAKWIYLFISVILIIFKSCCLLKIPLPYLIQI